MIQHIDLIHRGFTSNALTCSHTLRVPPDPEGHNHMVLHIWRNTEDLSDRSWRFNLYMFYDTTELLKCQEKSIRLQELCKPKRGIVKEISELRAVIDTMARFLHRPTESWLAFVNRE